MCWDVYLQGCTSLTSGVTLVSAVLLLQHWSVDKCAAGLRFGGVIMECTHDQYCDMRVVRGMNAQQITHRSGWRHPDTAVFRRLQRLHSEIGSVMPTELVNANRPQTSRTPAKEDVIIAAMGRKSCGNSRDIARKMGPSQPKLLNVLCDDQ